MHAYPNLVLVAPSCCFASLVHTPGPMHPTQPPARPPPIALHMCERVEELKFDTSDDADAPSDPILPQKSNDSKQWGWIWMPPG